MKVIFNENNVAFLDEDSVITKNINGKDYYLTSQDEFEINQKESEWESQSSERALKECYSERVKAYGAVGDQLDMIYHDGIDTWKAHIETIKETFPKPGV